MFSAEYLVDRIDKYLSIYLVVLMIQDVVEEKLYLQALIPHYITIIPCQMSSLLEEVNKNERYPRGDLTPLVPRPYIEINHAAWLSGGIKIKLNTNSVERRNRSCDYEPKVDKPIEA